MVFGSKNNKLPYCKNRKGQTQKSPICIITYDYILFKLYINLGVLCYIFCYLVKVYCIIIMCVTMMEFCLCLFAPVNRV